jgi:hypothetical protein
MKTIEHMAAIRKTEGHEWVDFNTVSGIRSVCEMLAREIDDKIPSWAKDNPVVDIRRIIITF